jgi:hypothetical protein
MLALSSLSIIRSRLTVGDPNLNSSAVDYLLAEGLSPYLDGLGQRAVFNSSVGEIYSAVDPENRVPFRPDAIDLARLHKTIRDRRVVTALEFGVGYSTLVMADALMKNERDYGEYVRANLRRRDAFKLYAIDADPSFIDLTKGMIPTELNDIIEFQFSAVSVSTFNDRVATYYDRLPNICPDFIYLDAPDQFIPNGDVRGISTNHPDRMPMSADVLAFEHFLTPGTLLIVDGRTANARFLKANLQRSWEYTHDESADIHTFELKEPPLGPYNRAHIEYCLGKSWLENVESSGGPA